LQLAAKNISTDSSLSSTILGKYGDREDVAEAFFAHLVSGTWTGPSSSHWEQLAEQLNTVAENTKLPRLASWATKHARALREMAERDRQREEEEELRGR
jgi:hypothetical protein